MINNSKKEEPLEKRRVLLDVDGTINDFQNHFIETVINMGYHYNYDKCDTYDMEKGIIHKDRVKIKEAIFNEPNFWLNVPILEGTVEGIKYLNDNYDLIIATIPWNTENQITKLTWLNHHYPFIKEKQIIFVKDNKWELDGDIIIEDKPKTIKKCQDYGFITVKKTQPYNLNIEANEELFSWTLIRDVMENIEREV